MSIIVAANLLMGGSNGLWEAIFQASSAVGNFGGAIGLLPNAYDWQAQAVVLPLALLGGLGIPVVLDIVASGFSWRRLHAYSRLVLLTTSVVYVIGTALIAWTYWMPGYDLPRTLVVSSTESLDARSLGMPLVALRELPRASVWIVLALMVVGGSPAGASGGITGVSLVLVGRDSVRLLRGQRISNLMGYLLVWIGAYLLAIFTFVLLMLHHAPQLPGDEALFLVVSAIGTVGRSAEPLTNTGAGLHILSLAMLFGRVTPLLILWRMSHAIDLNQTDLRTDFAR
jgi:trk system potassium uptake protein TrkH